jgi:ribonucleoside-diphosphate reductase alpha chain
MVLIKRSGAEEPFDLAKWQAQIDKVCEGVPDVSSSMIQMQAQAHFRDRMTSRDLDNMALRAIIDLIDEEQNPETGNTNYQFVGGKQRISMLRKDVYGQYEVPRLYDLVVRNVVAGVYTKDLLTWYTEAEWDQIEKFVEHDKDELFPYAAVDQLIEKYLVQNRVTGQVYETPQVRYAVAAATIFHAETTNRMRWVKDFYQCSSDGLFTMATPVLAGVGTPTKQFSSCVLIKSDDTLKSIFASGQVMADYAAKKAGIGLDVGRLRPLGSPIRGGEIKHTGYVPFLKKWFADLRSCSAGGIRNAAATVNFPFWHYQVDDLMVLKNNQGTEETRVRHMDYCVVVNAMMWRKFKKQEDLFFFDPSEVPEMYEAFYRDTKEFERLYELNSKRTDIRIKKMSAESFVKDMVNKERSDTGRYYILNIDNVANQGPLNVLVHPIYQTNLCTEIMQHTRAFQTVDDPEGRIALCTLGSLNWGAVRNPEELRKPARVLHRALHNLLQYQDFMSIHSELHNREFEPLGIGITNLAYWHAKRKMVYGEQEALDEIKVWMEHQAFYLTEMSVDLAQEKGKCLASDDTWYGKGVFPWERRANGVNDLVDFTPSQDLDWEHLRERMLKYGVRNATTMAIAPVESSSVVLNSTNGVNLIKQMIIIKASKAGEFAQVVPEYRRLKKQYQKLLLWEQKDCIEYIKTVAVLQVYVDQGISSDTFYSPKHFPEGKIPVTLVLKNLMLAHYWGLKSHYYHLIDKQGAADLLKAQAAAEEALHPGRRADDKPSEFIPDGYYKDVAPPVWGVDDDVDVNCESCVL